MQKPTEYQELGRQKKPKRTWTGVLWAANSGVQWRREREPQRRSASLKQRSADGARGCGQVTSRSDAWVSHRVHVPDQEKLTW